MNILPGIQYQVRKILYSISIESICDYLLNMRSTTVKAVELGVGISAGFLLYIVHGLVKHAY